MWNPLQYTFCFTVLQTLVHCSYGQSSIILSPTTQLVLPGAIANFSCIAKGAAEWKVNGKRTTDVLPSGVTETAHDETLDPNTFEVMTVLALQVEARPTNNATSVQCFSYGAIPDRSLKVYLIIAGPPLPPNPTLTLLNATKLQIYWDKPFTWTAIADILNYTVKMCNSSGDVLKNWTLSSVSNAVVLTKEGNITEQCEQLFFNVSATNVIGDSQVIPVSGGFPIAMKWSDDNGTQRLSSSVAYKSDGSTLITIRAKPPNMCSYQIAKYDVTITDIEAGKQLAATSVVCPYGTGEYIDIPIALRLAIREVRIYYAVLVVSSVGSANLQAIATFNVSPSVIPSNASKINDGGASETQMLIGLIVGSSSAVLFLIISLVILALVYKLRKAKTLKRESPTDHYYQEHPVAKSETSVRSHPPSEPIYEYIRDIQAESKECILAEEKKDYFCGSTQFVHREPTKEISVIDAPPLPSFSERARPTPDGDYVEMKVTAELRDESNCGGFSIPCGPLRETL